MSNENEKNDSLTSTTIRINDENNFSGDNFFFGIQQFINIDH